jgi:hypothetical protein
MKTNALLVTSYQGRENTVPLAIKFKDELVPPNTITKVVIKMEHVTDPGAVYCLNTQTPTDPIDLLEDSTLLRFSPGLIPDVVLGDYWVWITVYDGLAPNGIAWGAAPDRKGIFYDEPALYLKMVRWPVCST